MILDTDVLQAARLCAEQEARSVSQYINLILKRHLEQLAAKPQDERRLVVRDIRHRQQDKPSKTRISVTLDEPVVEQVRALADIDDRPLSQYINLLLKEQLFTEQQ